jgi:hypothetical protein
VSVKEKVALKVQPGRYRIRSVRQLESGANVLPHAVDVRMTTLRDGRARWTYSERFVARQFPSRAALDRTIAATVRLIRERAPSANVRRRGDRIFYSLVASREDFADSMVSEFIAWGSSIGRITLSQFMLTATRFVLAGWQP